MSPTKLIWNPHDLVGLMWILTNQKECVEKRVRMCVASISLYIMVVSKVINLWKCGTL